MVSHRSPQEREEIINVILDHLRARGQGWVTAREIALEVGHPWRVIARAMERVPDIEATTIEWISARQRKRTCNIYRYWGTPVSPYPTWLMPTPPKVMTGTGRIVRGYASLHDEQTLSESAND